MLKKFKYLSRLINSNANSFFLYILVVFNTFFEIFVLFIISLSIGTLAGEVSVNDYFPFINDSVDFFYVSIFLVILLAVFSYYINWYISYKSSLISASINNYNLKFILASSYLFQKDLGQAKCISLLTQENYRLLQSIINPYLLIIAKLPLIVGLFFYLLFIEPYLTIFFVFLMLFLYITLYLITHLKLEKNSITISDCYSQRQSLLESVFFNLKYVFLRGKGRFFTDGFEVINNSLALAQASNRFIGLLPKITIESLVYIAVLVVFILKRSSDTILFDISGFALVFLKLLPALQTIFASFSMIKGNSSIICKNYINNTKINLDRFHVCDDILNLISEVCVLSYSNINISYGKKAILHNADFKLYKNKINLITGPSGSGKSSLSEMVIGLNPPNNDIVCLNGISFNFGDYSSVKNLFSIVPQRISLINSTIISNVTLLPSESSDVEKVLSCLEMVGLLEHIKSLPNGLYTEIDDQSSLLSGGQRQRLAFARCLYEETPFIFLDENTSNLDPASELEIINLIDSLSSNITFLIIAHKQAFSEIADVTYLVDNKKITLIT